MTATDKPTHPDQTPHNRAALMARVRKNYVNFNRSELKVADLLLASPDLIGSCIATELARLASVSKTTVSRFINKLGLSGFDEFRRAARSQSVHAEQRYALGTPLQLMDEELRATAGDLERLVAATLASDQRNLEQTFATLAMDDLARTVDWLSQSRHLIFADFRKQYALAYYATTLFRVIRPGVSSLPIPGATAVDGTLDLNAEDTVVMFPFRRHELDQNTLSHAVKAAGAHLITLGDVWPNATNRRADIHFSCHTRSVGVFDSFVTPISLINLLFTATANQLGESAKERLALLEERHRMFATFDDV